MHQFTHNGNVMLVCMGCFYCVNKTVFFINTDMCLISEVPCIAFFAERDSGSRFFSLFFVDEGDSINVESTIVLFFRIIPRSIRIFTTAANIFSCCPLRVRILRKLQIVSPFRTSSGEFIPQKFENARLSITSFMTAMSARL